MRILLVRLLPKTPKSLLVLYVFSVDCCHFVVRVASLPLYDLPSALVAAAALVLLLRSPCT